jgi:hypothetical protein
MYIDINTYGRDLQFWELGINTLVTPAFLKSSTSDVQPKRSDSTLKFQTRSNIIIFKFLETTWKVHSVLRSLIDAVNFFWR